jgi:uracil-DNA glycosylase
MDWPALRQAVASCTACSLCHSRRQTVLGSGAPQAHWLLVGEAPGEQEDRRGVPFVGPSGELLGHMLAALGLSRGDATGAADAADAAPTDPARQVYITNTLKCRPPSNRNPSAAEMAQCEPFLLRQIALLQPRIIVAVGAFAVKALLGSDEPVGKLRGQVHRYGGVPLVVTYHPSYLLRQPQEKGKAWADWCLAAQVAAGHGPA